MNSTYMNEGQKLYFKVREKDIIYKKLRKKKLSPNRLYPCFNKVIPYHFNKDDIFLLAIPYEVKFLESKIIRINWYALYIK